MADGHRRSIQGLQVMSDEGLIASAEAGTSLSQAYPEMEMQRRLKAAIENLIKDSARARRSAF
jgi:hypothetical protein